MVRIRLTRLGAKKRPFYRVVAADIKAPRDGRFIEQLGYYDPMKEPKVIQLQLDRIDYWLSHGAQPTDTVASLITRARAAAAAAATAADELAEAAPAVESSEAAAESGADDAKDANEREDASS